MTDSSSNASGGIGVLGLLGVVFVTLKLCGVINWSWWLVTAPFWGGLALVLVLCMALLGGSVIFALWFGAMEWMTRGSKSDS